MQELQVQEILEGFKRQAGELTYQLIYRDAIIKAMDEELKKIQEEVKTLKAEKKALEDQLRIERE